MMSLQQKHLTKIRQGFLGLKMSLYLAVQCKLFFTLTNAIFKILIRTLAFKLTNMMARIAYKPIITLSL